MQLFFLQLSRHGIDFLLTIFIDHSHMRNEKNMKSYTFDG